MSRTDALLLIVAALLVAAGVFAYAWEAGLIATGVLLGALVLIDRAA